MTHSNFAAIWFDLDGTLFDTAGDLIPAVNATVTEIGHNAVEAERLRHVINFGSRGMLAYAMGYSRNDKRLDDIMPIFAKHYSAHLSDHTHWFPGMEDIITRLESDNIPWGIVTNKAERFSIPLIENLGLSQRIAGLVCGDTTDESKPSAKPLLHACTLAGHDPKQCLYIGDNATDIIAGYSAGMTTVAAAYGYVPEGESATNWGADFIITQPRDLQPIIWTEA